MTLTMTRKYQTQQNQQECNNADFLTFWREELEKLSSTHILHWTVDSFYPKLALKTAFEPEGCVILSMLSTIVPKITILCNEVDYQMQHFWSITRSLYRKTGLEIVPIHSYDGNNDDCVRFDAILGCARRQDQQGIRVLGMDMSMDIPVISPLKRWTHDAVIRKLKHDAIFDSSYINIWK